MTQSGPEAMLVVLNRGQVTLGEGHREASQHVRASTRYATHRQERCQVGGVRGQDDDAEDAVRQRHNAHGPAAAAGLRHLRCSGAAEDGQAFGCSCFAASGNTG
jgi:hypothetical protein